MDATKILSRIRELECELLAGYRELAISNEAGAAAMLNVSFAMTKELKSSSEEIKNNLKITFDANRSTIFTLCVERINAEPASRFEAISFDDETIKKIRALERKIVLELRELCITMPVIAKVCADLSDEQIKSLVECSVSDVMEFCYSSAVSVLKLRFKKEKALGELLKVASKPSFRAFGLVMDRIAC